MQGVLLFSSRQAQIFRNEAYLSYVAMTKDEAQHRRWTFYEAVRIEGLDFLDKFRTFFKNVRFYFAGFGEQALRRVKRSVQASKRGAKVFTWKDDVVARTAQGTSCHSRRTF